MSLPRNPKHPDEDRTRVHELSLDRITLDPEVQPRARGEDLDTMREYTAAWLEGEEFPPVDVFWDREEDAYYVADGFQRVKSAIAARRTSIRAHVHLGSRRAAILFAAGANATHGLKRSNDDKRAAVMKLLADPEWALWDDHAVARACKVSPNMVRQLRGTAVDTAGHRATARVGANGTIRTHDTPPPAAHAMKHPPLTKKEVHTLYASKIARHLRKSDPSVELDVCLMIGKIDIVASDRLYHLLIARDSEYITRVLGKMVIARHLLGGDRGITLIGHFAPSQEPLIAVLATMDIECTTPEQLLRRKKGAPT